MQRRPSAHELEDEVLKEKIKAIFMEHKGRYGSQRIKICLAKEGLQISRRRITRLLKCQGLYAKGQRRYPKPKTAGHTGVNLVNQQFQTKQKNHLWYGDITYIPTQEGTLYVSVFLDSYTRQCVGYTIREHMRESLVLESLQAAIDAHKPKPGLVIHTDNGSQYTGSAFIEKARKNQMITSYSRKGNPYDNAVMESFYKSLKREVLDKTRFLTKGEARIELVAYLENYYNLKRYHSSLGYMTPHNFALINT